MRARRSGQGGWARLVGAATGVIGVVVVTAVAVTAHPAAAAPPSTTFSYTGGTQSYTVPPGTSYLAVSVTGAAGDDGQGYGGGGNSGGAVTADLPVTPGEVLTVLAGGGGAVGQSASLFGGVVSNGGTGGVFSGGSGAGGYFSGEGGGGGAASAITTTSGGTTTVLAVAGGGGGGGGGGQGNSNVTMANSGGAGGVGGGPPTAGSGGAPTYACSNGCSHGPGGGAGGAFNLSGIGQTGQAGVDGDHLGGGGGGGGGGYCGPACGGGGGGGGAGGSVTDDNSGGGGGGGGAGGSSYIEQSALDPTYSTASEVPGQDGTVTITPVVPAATSVSMSASPDPSGVNQPVTVTATVSGGDGGGAVDFSAQQGASVVTACAAVPIAHTPNGTWQAQCNLPASVTSVPGSWTVTASYEGDALSAASSGSATQTVLISYATISSAGPTHGVAGQSYLFPFSVQGSQGLGTVSFPGLHVPSQACTGGSGPFTLSASGQISCTITLQPGEGTENITVDYSGSAAQGIQPLAQTFPIEVDPAATYVGFTPYVSSAPVGQPVQFTPALYVSSNPTTSIPYEYTWSISPDGSCGTDQSGVTTCVAASEGPHTVTATYDYPECAPSASSLCGQEVYPTGTDTFDAVGAVVSVAPDPTAASPLVGQPDTFVLQGYDAAGDPAGAQPGGDYSIAPDGTCFGATCIADSTGPHTVTVVDGAQSGSTVITPTTSPGSDSYSDLAAAAGAQFATSSTLTMTGTPTLGQVDTFEAGATTPGLGTNWGVGAFTYYLDGTPVPNCYDFGQPDPYWGTKAHCDITVNTPGPHAVSAVYSGSPTSGSSGTYSVSPSATTAYFTVTGPAQRIAISPAAATVTSGQAEQYTVEAYDAAADDLGPASGATLTISPDGSCSGLSCTARQAGPHTVQATSGGFTASTPLFVTPGPLDHLQLAPATSTVSPGQATSFTAYGYDAGGNPLGPVPATYSITSPGLCTGGTCSSSLGGAYTVTATSGSAVGQASLVVTSAVPSAPAMASATGGNTAATVSFGTPSDNGSPVSGYTVTATDLDTPGNGGQTATGTASSITVTGLTNGDTYTFSVTATNGVGTGAASAPSGPVVPAGPPWVPGNVGAAGGDTSATVQWTAPNPNGSPITGYTVTASDQSDAANGGQTATGSGSPILVGGLTDGDTYTFTVTATNAAGTSGPSAASNPVIPLPPAPTVTSVSPAAGPTAGGQLVTIMGTNFTQVTGVLFSRVAATSVTVVSPTEITAVTPAHTAASVLVAPVTTGGKAPTAARYTYDPVPAVASVSPPVGRAAGGTFLTVTGAGFLPGASVSIGGTPALRTRFVSAETLKVQAPPHSPGVVDVTVATPGGTSAPSPADQFSYLPLPTVAGLSTSSGPPVGGATLTVTGTGFTSVVKVSVGGTAAQGLTVLSPTQLQVTVPAHATGAVMVKVVTAGGASAPTPAAQYTYVRQQAGGLVPLGPARPRPS